MEYPVGPWRCLYCHHELKDGETCPLPDCVDARIAAARRMGVSTQSSKLYDVTHIDGQHVRFSVAGRKAAISQAYHYAKQTKHRYVVLHEGTDEIDAIVWPDGGVDYQPKGVML
jgi:hypothetical protein